MKRSMCRRFCGLIWAGAWLPVTISCNPSGWDGTVRIITDDWYRDEIVIYTDDDDDCGWFDFGCDDGGFDFSFDWWD